MKQRISLIIVLFFLLVQFTSNAQIQVFSNTTIAPCDGWNSNNTWATALSRNVVVSGLPNTGLSSTGTVLREVRVRLGNSTCRGNLSSYRLRVTNPQGVQVEIANGLTSTGNSIWVDMKFRDDIALERVKEYLSTTQTSYYPFSIGYYALETDGSFANFNTAGDPNGDWLFEIIENTVTEVSFEKVELVFGPPISIRDVTSCTTNNFCSGASCIYNGVFRGNNFGSGYPAGDPQYPGNSVNGCAWNGNNNNSAWFSFKPTSSTARLTISGMLNSSSPTSGDMQPIVVKANGNCGIPNIVPVGGCPKDQTINNRSYSNDVTINPAPNTGGISTGNIYINGISSNCEFNLSGLTVGDTYYLYVDGNGGSSSFFYIEVENGVSTPCDFCCTPITLTGPSSVCSGSSPVNFTITGGTGSGTWSVTPASAGTISNSGVFTPASGITSDILAQVSYTEGDCSRTADIIVTKCTTFGIYATAPWLTTCQSNSFFNTTGSGADLIDQAERKNFNDTTLGTFLQNSGTLKLRGAEVKTFKNVSLANVCSATLFYRIVPTSGTPGAFTSLDLPFFNDCNTALNQFPSGGPCVAGQQKWQEVLADNESPIDLTILAPGAYTLQVYYEITGDANSTSLCRDKITLDNAGRFYNAKFTIQTTPSLSSTNPTTCNGSEGTITISGLAPSTVYQLTYTDDGTTIGPADLTSDASGNIVITGLNAGTYTSFSITANGCATDIPGSITLVSINALDITPTITNNTVCNGTGGTGGGCVPSGSGIVINEVMAQPLDVTGCPLNNFGNPTCQGISRREYIELYNPTCQPIDISCYILGSASNSDANPTSTTSFDFSVIIPPNTILQPKSHYVIGGSTSTSDANSIDFKVDLNLSNMCSVSGRQLLPNGDGWLGLYNGSGSVIDAIYWTVSANQGNKILNNDDELNDRPCTPTGTGCNTTGVVLKSAVEIYNQSPSLINYVGQTNTTLVGGFPQPNGKTFSRIPDGGAWQRDINPSIDGSNCNNGQCDVSNPPTPGTCNGAVSVVASGGSDTYNYEWRDANNTIIGTTSSVSNLCAGTYTVKVTDSVTNCSKTFNVTVNDNIQLVEPAFNSYGPFCQGNPIIQPILPETSNNGIKGSWSPASLSTDVSGDIIYTFTPDPSLNQCADTTTIIVKVNPRVTPTFPYGTTLTICSGDPTPNLLGLSSNNILGTWNPNPVSNTQSDVYTFTPLGNACANQTTFTVTVIQRPNVTVRPDTTVYHNAVYPGDIFSGLPVGSTVSWTNSNPSIGLPSVGTGNVPAFTAINIGSNPVIATITVSSTNGNCAGAAKTYRITVLPLNRDVFVPNVFTPNGDGRNDQLFVFGNYITRLEMRIFNQWGEMIKLINNPAVGWDGTHNGKPQPVGVYVYTLRATLADGTEVNKKGSITLVR
jgi:gliding motility-associated-like protein